MRGEPIPLWRARCCIGRGDQDLEVWFIVNNRWLERTAKPGVYKWGGWVLKERSAPVAYVWMQPAGCGQLKLHSTVTRDSSEQLRRNAEAVLETEGAADAELFISEHVAPLWAYAQ